MWQDPQQSNNAEDLSGRWIGIGLMLLAGCSGSPSFVDPPPAFYRVPLPVEFHGTWAREGKDNGERVRVTGQEDGTVRFDFFQTRPSDEPPLAEPLLAQTLRFDNTDWLLLDWRKLSAWQGGRFAGPAPYKLVKYVLEDPDRLCGIEPSARLFAEAIESEQLKGTVDTSDKPLLQVTVTSAGADWVKWWGALPKSRKTLTAPAFCFQRAN